MHLIKFEQRFWSKVDICGPDECWPWLGYKDSYGYGRLGSKLTTHVLWFLRHGEWPSKGRTANHHCDNPSCINPKHLYLGTQKSNTRDREQRGRGNQCKGEQHYETRCRIKREMNRRKQP